MAIVGRPFPKGVEAISGTGLELPAGLTEYIRKMEDVFGYDLPPGEGEVFIRTWQWLVREPPTARINFLRGEEGQASKNAHYQRLKSGVWRYGDIHQGLIRAQYHRDRVCQMEDQFEKIAKETNVAELCKRMGLGGGAVGGGNTLALDSEYQAFILAVRSTLDYLTGSVCAYFKNESHSFHGWPGLISRLRPAAAAERIGKVLRSHHSGLDHFFLCERTDVGARPDCA